MDSNITKMRYSEYSPVKLGNVLLGTEFEYVIHEELLWNQNNEVPLAAQPAECLPSTNEFSSSHRKLNIRWHTSVSLAIRRWKKEDGKFKVILGYLGSSKLAWAFDLL